MFSEGRTRTRKNIYFLSVLLLTSSLLVSGGDWPMQSGNAARNGWAKSEHLLTKQNISGLSVLYKVPVDNRARGSYDLTSPIINGNLITYLGFKEMLIFGSSSDKVFSVDADLNRPIWESKFEASAAAAPESEASDTCPGGMTAPVLMAGSSSASMHFAARSARRPAAAGLPPLRPRSPYFPALSQDILPLRPTSLSELAALYAVSGDGKLHVLNSSTGADLIPPFRFLPAGAKPTSLNIHGDVVYATTADHCDGHQNALYALNLLTASRGGAVFSLPYGGFSGSAGTAIGNDGTVYVQVAHGTGHSLRDYYDAVLALTPGDLRVKDYIVLSSKHVRRPDLNRQGITPMVFSWNGRDIVLAGGRDGRLYLLDSRSLGGSDHKTPLSKTEVMAARGKAGEPAGFVGAFASSFNVDTQARWIYVPVGGPLASTAGLPSSDNAKGSGFVVAMQFVNDREKPALRPLWASQEISSPAPLAAANGMIFALSRGTLAKGKDKSESVSGHAVLYALDALNGKQLYTSEAAAAAPSEHGGLAVANGRIYFATNDHTVYCFGLLKTQPQLMERE